MKRLTLVACVLLCGFALAQQPPAQPAGADEAEMTADLVYGFMLDDKEEAEGAISQCSTTQTISDWSDEHEQGETDEFFGETYYWNAVALYIVGEYDDAELMFDQATFRYVWAFGHYQAAKDIAESCPNWADEWFV